MNRRDRYENPYFVSGPFKRHYKKRCEIIRYDNHFFFLDASSRLKEAIAAFDMFFVGRARISSHVISGIDLIFKLQGLLFIRQDKSNTLTS